MTTACHLFFLSPFFYCADWVSVSFSRLFLFLSCEGILSLVFRYVCDHGFQVVLRLLAVSLIIMLKHSTRKLTSPPRTAKVFQQIGVWCLLQCHQHLSPSFIELFEITINQLDVERLEQVVQHREIILFLGLLGQMISLLNFGFMIFTWPFTILESSVSRPQTVNRQLSRKHHDSHREVTRRARLFASLTH